MADQLSIRDVRWFGNSTLCTAGANGRIFTYDLNRISTSRSEPLEYIQTQEDSRQVNSLDFNPHLQSWLLSGSQDGMARVFDASNPVNSKSGMITFRQRFAPLRCIDAIREVKWSPRMGHEMACCTESGVILKWDVRHAARPLLRINAHEKACSAIAWHPDGNHLVSAGWDAKLYVWDLKDNADKRQKPKWAISTPAPVTNVAWRPGVWSASSQSRRMAQVAVTYDENSNKRYGIPIVHVWDLARPTLPYKEIERFDSSPTALWWRDQDMLWTVDQDGMFNQCDVAYAPKALDRLSTSAAAFSSRGDAVLFLDERTSSPRPRHALSHKNDMLARAAYNTVANAQGLSVSKSDSEEEAIGTFLGPRWKTQRSRRPSARNSISITPPSSSVLADESKPIMSLEQAIKSTGMFKSHQGMASGHIPAAKSVGVYQYLSSVYLETLERDLPVAEGCMNFTQRVVHIMDQFATAAEGAGLFRLAQTWRILGYAMTLLLDQRAQYHLETRLSLFQKLKLEASKAGDKLKPIDLYRGLRQSGQGNLAPEMQQGSPAARSLSARSLLAEDIGSTSNVPTPLARPVDGTHDVAYQQQLYPHGKKLAPIVEPDTISLGPAAHGTFRSSPRQRLDSTPISIMSVESETTQVSITSGYDFYDADALAQAIDVPRSREDKRSWNHAPPPSASARKHVVRQDSEESYGQMFSISNGTRQANPESYMKTISRQSSDVAKRSEGGDTDFESRIRGEELALASSIKNGRDVRTDSPEEIFMISQTTMTDDTFPSQPSFTTRSYSGSQNDVQFVDKESIFASQSPPTMTPPQLRPPFQHDSRPEILETDYLYWPEDPDYPYPTAQNGAASKLCVKGPLDPYTLVKRALEFESRTSALNAFAMVLLLKPLVPNTVIDDHQARAVLRQQHSRLMSMGLFVEASLLRNLSIKGWPEGIPDWGENYTTIFGASQQSLVKASLFCSSCRKPREVDHSQGDQVVWTCERCKSIMAPCAVCGHRDLVQADYHPTRTEETSTMMSHWWYCPGCAHGGHSSCLQDWHGSLDDSGSPDSIMYSDGCCPLDGCGHACLPGRYRGEMSTARSDEVGRAAVETSRIRDERINSGRASPRPGQERSVRSDGNDIPQSRAVGMAREALNKAPGSGGILSSSPGRTVDRERRKSVKFAPGGSETF
ncbi:hypothetical protein B0I35DRAFT_435490 [Stachybotrys elegans]|uniref:WD repeat protein n=1 Tax=Stachybotrys elegans TaxID=80388 RepID=A0A8K0WP99_9HYPO|nr:hypothetical protein B0I35DRAFT_435490 [Stachybotrys elegans]